MSVVDLVDPLHLTIVTKGIVTTSAVAWCGVVIAQTETIITVSETQVCRDPEKVRAWHQFNMMVCHCCCRHTASMDGSAEVVQNAQVAMGELQLI